MNQTSQPGFFTLGIRADQYDLPHPRISLPVILLIRRVLCRSFELLRKENYPFAEAKEDVVTAALASVIENNLRHHGSVKGFNRWTYEKVVRQSQVSSFNGVKIRTSPDICFKLRDRETEPPRTLSEHDGLFIECKPVDSAHAVTTHYCSKGITRFISGDYGWAMQEGMMLAFARDGKTISVDLVPALDQAKFRAELNVIDPPKPHSSLHAVAEPGVEQLYISRHSRSFDWPDGKGPACEITIYHLWHDCDK